MSTKGDIFLVENDPGIQLVVAETLEEEGYEVQVAPDGAAAIAMLGSIQPLLILVDPNMPVMDGWEFLRRYRKAPGPHAPVIIFSADSAAADQAERAGADGFLGKPFQIDELLALVARYASTNSTSTS